MIPYTEDNTPPRIHSLPDKKSSLKYRLFPLCGSRVPWIQPQTIQAIAIAISCPLERGV